MTESIPALIILALRLGVPLLILKQPFWGMLAAVLADGFETEAAKIIFPLFGEPLGINF